MGVQGFCVSLLFRNPRGNGIIIPFTFVAQNGKTSIPRTPITVAPDFSNLLGKCWKCSTIQGKQNCEFQETEGSRNRDSTVISGPSAKSYSQSDKKNS